MPPLVGMVIMCKEGGGRGGKKAFIVGLVQKNSKSVPGGQSLGNAEEVVQVQEKLYNQEEFQVFCEPFFCSVGMMRS